MSDSHRTLGLLLVLGAAVLWGTTGTIQTLLPDTKQPVVVAAMRMLIGAATLLALAGCSGRARAGFRALPLGGVLAAGASIAAYNVLFFLAIPSAGVGVGTALAIGGAPVWVTLYEVLARRRLPGPGRLAGQGICILGAVLLVLSGRATDASLTGILLAVLAGGGYAAYSVVTGRIGHRAPPVTVAAGTFGVAALLLAPALILLPTAWLAEPGVMARLGFLGVVVTGLSYVLYTWGLRHVAASTGVTLALAEPLTAWLLATFLIGEPVSPARILGAGLLLLGLGVVTRTGAPQHEGR